jgi:hypothetical protein
VQGAGLGFLQKAELIPIHGLAFSWGRRSAIWRGPGFMGHPRERWGLFPGITSAFQWVDLKLYPSQTSLSSFLPLTFLYIVARIKLFYLSVYIPE